jgi:hypothetical protein
MTTGPTRRRTSIGSWGGRKRIAWVAATIIAVTIVAPVEAYETKTRVLFRDGQVLVIEQDVGNQAFDYQWVENDPRRHADDELTVYYRIDLTELPPGVSAAKTEAAIEAAVATFRSVTCGRNLELVRVNADPGQDLGYVQHLVGMGGEASPTADITFAGWLPREFMDEVGLPGSFGISLPLVWQTDGTLAWGIQVWDPNRSFTDVNRDRKHDMFATEIYFNADWNYVTDDKALADTLFYIDVQTIALHELGHALGMGHFGRSTLVLEADGTFVDLSVNPHSASLMNTNSYYQKRDLSGSDVASFCGLYANWGSVGPAS